MISLCRIKPYQLLFESIHSSHSWASVGGPLTANSLSQPLRSKSQCENFNSTPCHVHMGSLACESSLPEVGIMECMLWDLRWASTPCPSGSSLKFTSGPFKIQLTQQVLNEFSCISLPGQNLWERNWRLVQGRQELTKISKLSGAHCFGESTFVGRNFRSSKTTRTQSAREGRERDKLEVKSQGNLAREGRYRIYSDVLEQNQRIYSIPKVGSFFDSI